MDDIGRQLFENEITTQEFPLVFGGHSTLSVCDGQNLVSPTEGNCFRDCPPDCCSGNSQTCVSLRDFPDQHMALRSLYDDVGCGNTKCPRFGQASRCELPAKCALGRGVIAL